MGIRDGDEGEWTMLTREGWMMVALFIGGPTLLFLLALASDVAGCHGRWEESGYSVKYGMMSGCIVNFQGRWMPEKAIRALD
jgi:hypothetical protein